MNDTCYFSLGRYVEIPRPKGAPCQEPSLFSFVAHQRVEQVDFRHCSVDLQRFGEGLWPKRWQARRLKMRSTRTFVTPVKLFCHGGCQQENQVKVINDVKRK